MHARVFKTAAIISSWPKRYQSGFGCTSLMQLKYPGLIETVNIFFILSPICFFTLFQLWLKLGFLLHFSPLFECYPNRNLSAPSEGALPTRTLKYTMDHRVWPTQSICKRRFRSDAAKNHSKDSKSTSYILQSR